MQYILLCAGVGSRLHPYTKTFPKSMIQVKQGKTVLTRTIDMIKAFDRSASICLVVGYMRSEVINSVGILNIDNLVYNPFYRMTNSIASIWLARHLLNTPTIIMNGDIPPK